jgi:regulator of Ty1 transposition protein 103
MVSSIVEVAQQSKARRKDDFLIAFSPVIAEATATAYKGATSEVQQKLRRVVEVWRQRQIFEQPIQEAIEARIDGMIYKWLSGTPANKSRT